MADQKQQAEKFRLAGNEAIQKGNVKLALKNYSEAIALDSEDATVYSNRSAAFCAIGRFDQALDDAEVAIKLKPDWAKAHARKGAALSRMDKHEAALMAYMEAFCLEPENNDYKEYAKAERKMSMGGSNQGLMNPFGDSDVKIKLMKDPITAAYMQQEDFRNIIDELHHNPNELGKYLEDSRVMDAIGILLGVNMNPMQGDQVTTNGAQAQLRDNNFDKNIPQNTARDAKPQKAEDLKAKDKDTEKMDVEITGDQIKVIGSTQHGVDLTALEEKEKGNAAYKKKDFETALGHYAKAIELDPTNITFRTNRAAVYYEQKEYDKCIKECEEAVETGRENRADFKLIAKALSRIGNAYTQQEDYRNAIAFYKKSLSEHRAPEIVKKVVELEKKAKELERLAYVDPEKSLEEKNKGNECFKKGDFPGAIKFYTEAIKRNPDDAKVYSNRAACYTKLAEFNMALKDADECIRLDPSFLKGYLRKGATLLTLKKYTQAQTIFEKALELHPNHPEAMEGYKKCVMEQNDPEAVRTRAMQDPEVQKILGDPAMQMILQQMQKDPNAIQEHLKNPEIAAKIQKLMDSGLIAMRHM